MQMEEKWRPCYHVVCYLVQLNPPQSDPMVLQGRHDDPQWFSRLSHIQSKAAADVTTVTSCWIRHNFLVQCSEVTLMQLRSEHVVLGSGLPQWP